MRRLAARLPAVRRSVVDYWTRSPPVLQGIARVFAVAAVVVIGAHAHALEPAEDGASAVDWVNSYIGTGGGGSDYGGTMPFVTTPFGMTNWTAQTRENRISVSSYAFEDDTIAGFIGTHQPAIWMGDYGYVTLAPEVDAVRYPPTAASCRSATPTRSRRRITTRCSS